MIRFHRVVLRTLQAAGLGLPTLFAAAGETSADPVIPGEEHCVVNVRADDSLNFRAAPAARSRIVHRKAYADCGVVVTADCRGSWCPVDDGHAAGWANRRFLAAVSPSLYCVDGVARGDTLQLRAFPAPESRILTRLDRRQCGIAFLPYRVGAWQKIRVGGWEGWAHRRYLSGQ